MSVTALNNILEYQLEALAKNKNILDIAKNMPAGLKMELTTPTGLTVYFDKDDRAINVVSEDKDLSFIVNVLLNEVSINGQPVCIEAWKTAAKIGECFYVGNKWADGSRIVCTIDDTRIRYGTTHYEINGVEIHLSLEAWHLLYDCFKYLEAV